MTKTLSAVYNGKAYNTQPVLAACCEAKTLEGLKHDPENDR